MAYYFTNDRILIMAIGLQYGLYCCTLASLCLHKTAYYCTHLLFIIKEGFDKGRDEKLTKQWAYYVIFLMVSFFYYHVCKY